MMALKPVFADDRTGTAAANSGDRWLLMFVCANHLYFQAKGQKINLSPKACK